MARYFPTLKVPALLALAVPLAAAAGQTLCKLDETDFFSCKVAGGRLISVCGKIHDEPRPEDWLQYRRGLPGRLATAWPEDRSGSLGQFEGNVFGPYAVSDLRFKIGDTLYGISVSRGGESDGAGGQTRRGAELYARGQGHDDVTYECLHPDIARYGQSFEALNALLVNERGTATSR